MANRVVLGEFDGTYVLRVSRPGFNVLSTGLASERLAFDSRWQEASNVYMRGSTTVSATGSRTINFGTTFSRPPLVIARILGSSGAYITLGAQDDLNPNGTPIGVVVTTSNFQLRKNFPPHSGGFGGTRTVHYTVMRNLYG